MCENALKCIPNQAFDGILIGSDAKASIHLSMLIHTLILCYPQHMLYNSTAYPKV